MLENISEDENLNRNDWLNYWRSENLRLKVEELSFAFLKILVEFSLSFCFLDSVMNE